MIRKIINKTSKTTRVLMTLLIIFWAVFIVQMFISESIGFFLMIDKDYAGAELKTEDLSSAQRISKASKVFLADGTIHLIHTSERSGKGEAFNCTVQFYLHCLTLSGANRLCRL